MFAVTGTDEILLLGEVTADADGNFAYELTAENLSSLGEGENKAIRATQTDAAGNASEPTELFPFVVDTTLSPQLSITSVGGDDGIVSGNRDDNLIVGVGEAGATVELFMVTDQGEDPIKLGETTSDADGNFAYELTAENRAALGKVRIKRLEQRRLTQQVMHQNLLSCYRLRSTPRYFLFLPSAKVLLMVQQRQRQPKAQE